MKNIKEALIDLLKKGHCTPRIAKVARTLKEPATTIHYNIKQLEKSGAIKTYKAVFDYKKIEEGYCNYALINLSPEEYANPERLARLFARFDQIESIDILSGDWEMILKIRTKDIDEYYDFVKKVLSQQGVSKVKTLASLKEIKTEFVEL